MGRRPLLGMVLGWLAVVVAVAAITFVVVDRAGRGVGQASAARTVGPSATTSPPAPTTPATTSSTPEPTGSASPPVTEPSGSPTVRPAQPRTASFTTEGGTVVAECAGTELRLVSITPRDGWRFEQESEHGGLEVKLKGDERDVEILVVCRRGVPVRAES